MPMGKRIQVQPHTCETAGDMREHTTYRHKLFYGIDALFRIRVQTSNVSNRQESRLPRSQLSANGPSVDGRLHTTLLLLSSRLKGMLSVSVLDCRRGS